MTVYHPGLANGRWQQMTFFEQMANVGSEVERAFAWKEKNNPDRSMRAYERALELLNLTIENPTNRLRLKEIVRTREIFTDIFLSADGDEPSVRSLKKYFLEFAYAARKNVRS